jgi:hypothetical protein
VFQTSLLVDGWVVVFSGDFRQCLPIVVGRTPLPQIVKRCILSAEFEPEMNFLTMTENMRILSAEVSREETLVLRRQAQLLLLIGSGYYLQDGVSVENINVNAYYPDNVRCMSTFLKKIFPIEPATKLWSACCP